MLGVQLGTVGQQLGVTGREQVTQPTHKHGTSCKDEERSQEERHKGEISNNCHLQICKMVSLYRYFNSTFNQKQLNLWRNSDGMLFRGVL